MKKGNVVEFQYPDSPFKGKGVLREFRSQYSDWIIDLFNGQYVYCDEENITVLTGFRAVKPGDYLVNREGLERTAVEVFQNVFVDDFGNFFNINSCAECGWTIKGQKKKSKLLTPDEAFQAAKERKSAWTWDLDVNGNITNLQLRTIRGYVFGGLFPYHADDLSYSHASFEKPE